MDLNSNDCVIGQFSNNYLYEQIVKDSQTTCQLAKNIKQRLENSQLQANGGNRFLALRNNLLLEYLIQLVKYNLLKIDKTNLQDHQVINELFKLRACIKKTDLVYQKMKYQIEKVISEANTGKVVENDPLAFKPCPQNLLVDVESSEEDNLEEKSFEESEDENETSNDKSTFEQKTQVHEKTKVGAKKNKVYVPPKIIPMNYDEEKEINENLKKEKALERAKKKAMSSDIIAELRAEFDEGPEEIVEKNLSRKKPNKKAEEKTQYEEEHMIRLRKTKQDKRHESKQSLMTISSLSSHITQFDNISSLDVDNPAEFKIKKKKAKLQKSSLKIRKKKFSKRKKRISF